MDVCMRRWCDSKTGADGPSPPTLSDKGPACTPPSLVYAGKPLDLDKEDLRKRQEAQ